MPTGTKFARASYVFFSLAVMAALLKLGGISGAEPFILRTVPATPVAADAPGDGSIFVGEPLDLPEPTPAAEWRVGASLLLDLAEPLEEGAGADTEADSDEAPVFYRPTAGSGGAVCGDLGDFPRSSRVVFPLPEAYFNSYDDTWGAARPQGGHEGSDLMSPAGTPEFAVTDGTLVSVKGSNKNGWNRLGGYAVMLKADYDVGPIRAGDLFYYAHMDEKSALKVGTKVRAGQQLGVVGDTGEGREGTRGKFPPHLHFGWYDAELDEDRTSVESGAMNPYPLLSWLEKNGGAISGGTDASYCEAPQEDPAPSAGTDDGRNAGTRPDLDTGDPGDASPAVEQHSHDHEARSPGIEEEPREEAAVADPDEPDEEGEDRGTEPAERDGRDEPEEAPEKEPAEARSRPAAPEPEEPGDEEPTGRRPSGEERSPGTEVREKVRDLLPAARPGQEAPRPQYASVLANVLRGLERAASDGGNDEDAREKGRDEGERATAPKPSKEKEPVASDRTRPAGGEEGPGAEHDGVAVVRITRDTHDGQQQKDSIGRDEWLAVVEKDPELRTDEAAEERTGADRAARHENGDTAAWTGHPDRREVRFELRDGEILVKSPDGPTVEKTRKVAEALGAEAVRGDEE